MGVWVATKQQKDSVSPERWPKGKTDDGNKRVRLPHRFQWNRMTCVVVVVVQLYMLMRGGAGA